MIATDNRPALRIVGSDGPVLFGLSTGERLRRQFARAGIGETDGDGAVIVVRADAVIDQPLVPVLAATPNLLLAGEGSQGSVNLAARVEARDTAIAVAIVTNAAPPGLGLIRREPADLDVKFWKTLRKRETPYAFAASAANAEAIEWRMFMGTYKGATDLVTRHVWPVPAFHATRWLAPRGITPNMVTSLGALLMVAAFVLFLSGSFGLGLVAAWAMTFLDTVDGKLARTTLTSSKWGDIFDHGIDLVHPPFWYVAWALGLAKLGINWSPVTFWWVIGAILGGYLVQRIIEGIAIKWLGLEIHIWRKIDTLFRQVTARRNPNLILLTLGTIVGRPDLGLMTVAVWTLACLVLHGLQLAQGLAARRKGPLSSWMMAG
ncbi:MAG: CDP-alcohol phosphatidyltransferase family protein [Rhizobiales bacterium]|nr:CDP-alcohol phosphatidyltransferase family protein [Hyphomicrobiales bacterium]MBI3673412.1 CDP-alcohol phosphatidyltransferase family protein [Hyphomicrobiales bacterium]